MKETLFIKKIITLKLVFYEILSFKPKNLTSGNLKKQKSTSYFLQYLSTQMDFQADSNCFQLQTMCY